MLSHFNHTKMSELVWDIKNGELDSVKNEIENKGIDVNLDVNGRPLILHAADYGQHTIVNYLISKGADPNAKDSHGITALLAAIWEGHTECVKVLVSKGAFIKGVSPDGTSYYDAAEKDEIKALLK
ncbi:myotrophin-like [Daphnia pulex]|uniref:myotrophin-like n=1 Tax=Daphnia pulex TaxID=6669 RepID=UPI001EDF8E63|nr:myotrophin-like [Daphnia pulex]XP_046638806.1 myotrophin-like [Daphnia pulicaria]XP_046657733.1 myotrophin-like [Daphnia pulicaria]